MNESPPHPVPPRQNLHFSSSEDDDAEDDHTKIAPASTSSPDSDSDERSLPGTSCFSRPLANPPNAAQQHPPAQFFDISDAQPVPDPVLLQKLRQKMSTYESRLASLQKQTSDEEQLRQELVEELESMRENNSNILQALEAQAREEGDRLLRQFALHERQIRVDYCQNSAKAWRDYRKELSRVEQFLRGGDNHIIEHELLEVCGSSCGAGEENVVFVESSSS